MLDTASRATRCHVCGMFSYGRDKDGVYLLERIRPAVLSVNSASNVMSVGACRHFAYAARSIVRLSRKDDQRREFTCCPHLGGRKSLVAHARAFANVRTVSH